MLRKRVGLLLAVVGGMAWLSPPTTATPGVQSAQATAGSFATGANGYQVFPDGIARSISAVLVIPDGTVVASPSATAADLSKPWAVLETTIWRSTGELLNANQGCSIFLNPTSWKPASETGRTAGARGMERVVGGMHFAAPACPDDPTYSSFTVRWDAATYDDGPAWVYHYDIPWLQNRAWEWDNDGGGTGTLEADITSTENAAVTICGNRRSGEAADCTRLNGGGQIYPSLTTINAKAAATG